MPCHSKVTLSQQECLVALSNATITVGSPPQTLISGLDLSFRAGERLAILGTNGCGKSILANQLGRTLATNHEDGGGGSLAQRRTQSRGQLALGFRELQELEASGGWQSREQQPPSEPGSASERDLELEGVAVYFISFESHRQLLHAHHAPAALAPGRLEVAPR